MRSLCHPVQSSQKTRRIIDSNNLKSHLLRIHLSMNTKNPQPFKLIGNHWPSFDAIVEDITFVTG